MSSRCGKQKNREIMPAEPIYKAKRSDGRSRKQGWDRQSDDQSIDESTSEGLKLGNERI